MRFLFAVFVIIFLFMVRWTRSEDVISLRRYPYHDPEETFHYNPIKKFTKHGTNSKSAINYILILLNPDVPADPNCKGIFGDVRFEIHKTIKSSNKQKSEEGDTMRSHPPKNKINALLTLAQCRNMNIVRISLSNVQVTNLKVEKPHDSEQDYRHQQYEETPEKYYQRYKRSLNLEYPYDLPLLRSAEPTRHKPMYEEITPCSKDTIPLMVLDMEVPKDEKTAPRAKSSKHKAQPVKTVKPSSFMSKLRSKAKHCKEKIRPSEMGMAVIQSDSNSNEPLGILHRIEGKTNDGLQMFELLPPDSNMKFNDINPYPYPLYDEPRAAKTRAKSKSKSKNNLRSKSMSTKTPNKAKSKTKTKSEDEDLTKPLNGKLGFKSGHGHDNFAKGYLKQSKSDNDMDICDDVDDQDTGTTTPLSMTLRPVTLTGLPMFDTTPTKDLADIIAEVQSEQLFFPMPNKSSSGSDLPDLDEILQNQQQGSSVIVLNDSPKTDQEKPSMDFSKCSKPCEDFNSNSDQGFNYGGNQDQGQAQNKDLDLLHSLNQDQHTDKDTFQDQVPNWIMNNNQSQGHECQGQRQNQDSYSMQNYNPTNKDTQEDGSKWDQTKTNSYEPHGFKSLYQEQYNPQKQNQYQIPAQNCFNTQDPSKDQVNDQNILKQDQNPNQVNNHDENKNRTQSQSQSQSQNQDQKWYDHQNQESEENCDDNKSQDHGTSQNQTQENQGESQNQTEQVDSGNSSEMHSINLPSLINSLKHDFYNNFLNNIKSDSSSTSSSLLSMVEKLLGQVISMRSENGYFALINGGNVSDLKNCSSDLVKSLHYINSNCGHEDTVLVMTATTPQDNSEIPLLVSGPDTKSFESINEFDQVLDSIGQHIKNHDASKDQDNGNDIDKDKDNGQSDQDIQSKYKNSEEKDGYIYDNQKENMEVPTGSGPFVVPNIDLLESFPNEDIRYQNERMLAESLVRPADVWYSDLRFAADSQVEYVDRDRDHEGHHMAKRYSHGCKATYQILMHICLLQITLLQTLFLTT